MLNCQCRSLHFTLLHAQTTLPSSLYILHPQCGPLLQLQKKIKIKNGSNCKLQNCNIFCFILIEHAWACLFVCLSLRRLAHALCSNSARLEIDCNSKRKAKQCESTQSKRANKTFQFTAANEVFTTSLEDYYSHYLAIPIFVACA